MMRGLMHGGAWLEPGMDAVAGGAQGVQGVGEEIWCEPRAWQYTNV